MSSHSLLTHWVVTTPDAPWHVPSHAPELTTAAGNLALSGRADQTWEGFGGCFNELGWIALSVLDDAERDTVLRALFDPADGCRFTVGRLPIGASDYAAEWYSHDEVDGDFALEHFSIARDRKYLLPYIQAALGIRPDLTLFASPWSPPTWLKFPKAYNYGTLIWQPEYLRTYANYFLKFVQAYRDAGVTIKQIHIQNEPVADQKFPSCLWTGAQLRDFIRDYCGPLFSRELPDCEIWLGTLNTGDYEAFPLTVLSDPAAREYVAGVGFQWAGKEAVQRTHESWAEVRLMQTENECGDGRNSWEYARYIFNLLQHYITNGVNAYVYWNMVLPEGGLSTWGWRQNAMISINPDTRAVTYNPEFYLMRHFARFIQPDAVRQVLCGAWTGNSVAFTNPDGSTVIVIANPFPDPRPLALETQAGTVALTLEGYSFNTLVL